VKITKEQLQSGLVAYYPFSGNAMDGSGNGNHGEVNGATLAKDRHDAGGSAYDFDGTDDVITIGDGLVYTNKITISAWIKAGDQVKRWDIIVGGPKYDILFALDRGSFSFGGEWNEPFKADTRSSTSLNDKRWHHVVASYDGSTVNIHVDGSLERSNQKTGSFQPSKKNIGKGGDSPPLHFTGSIDDVRIYNRALSAEEVKALYDLEKPKAE